MYVTRLQDAQIAEIIRAISDEDAEVTEIHRPYTDPEVTVLSQDMVEHYVLHDYDIEGFEYLPENATYIYREKMLKFFGIGYAEHYLLRK